MNHYLKPRFLLLLTIIAVMVSTLPWPRLRAQTPAPAPAPPASGTPAGEAGAPNDAPVQGDDAGAFVLKKDVEEVILHATVVDEQRHLVSNLDRSAFSVFENQAPQTITSFHREDVPVAMGILIDNSGSMRAKREKVNQAVFNLLLRNNPEDEIFVVNFNQEAYLDQDFTSDVGLLRQAVERVSMRGSTALYDAIVASSRHLKNGPRPENKVLLVITDGWDDASRETLQQARWQLQQANGPALYAIGLLDPSDHGGRAALAALALSTGGAAFFPASLDELDEISRTIGRDIRSRYTIGYKSTNSDHASGYRSIRVEAHASGYSALAVRTRQGYYPGEVIH